MSKVGISPPPPTWAGSSTFEAGSASSADILVLPHHRLVARKYNRLGGKPNPGDALRGTVRGSVLVLVRHGVLHEFFVVAVREVLAEVAAAGFLAVQGSNRHDLRQFQQEAEFNGLKEV